MGNWLSHEIKEGFPPYSVYDCVLMKGLIIIVNFIPADAKQIRCFLTVLCCL